jgi:uncharacterized protein
MRTIFLDTVGLLAIWDQDDPWHAVADSAWRQIIAAPVTWITTAYILLECGNAAARTPSRVKVDELRRQLERLGTLIHPGDPDWVEAWEHYMRREAAAAGIVDQVSFAVMRRLGVSEAFTNDRHFKAAGFVTLF